MKIVVNTHLLLKDKMDGLGWFTYESLKRIVHDHPEHEFVFVFDRPYAEEFIFADNVRPIVLGPPARHPFLWFLRYEIRIPALLRREKPDLYISTDGWLTTCSKVKTVQVLHDLNFVHSPENLPFLMRLYLNYFFPRYAHKATRMATVSEYSKEDIVNTYHISPDKIDVVYNGANEAFVPLDVEKQKEIRAKYSKGCEYFLFVGSLLPRKNLGNLLKGFDLYKKSSEGDVKLLIVGGKKWWTTELEDIYTNMTFKDDVIFTGRVDTDDLGGIIASALAMTYVSYFEGFGIPLVEAMYCGVPIITSNCTSMPEVAADAALYADPNSFETIADAMKQMAENPTLREELVRKGQIRKKAFSWQQTADKLWNCIEKTINSLC